MQNKTLQVGFTVGEVDPLLTFRSDMKDYQLACKQLKNFALLVEGGCRRRPGTRYKATLPNGPGRIIPFVFNLQQEYIFWLTNLRLDVYNSDGSVAQANIVAPWTASQLFDLTYSSAGDTTVFCHKDMTQQLVKRTGSSTFTVGSISFETDSGGAPYMPFVKYAASGTTLALSAVSGAGVTATMAGSGAGSGASVFTANHVGTYLRYGTTKLLVTGFTSATVVTVTVDGTASGTAANTAWDEQAWSVVHGYPRACLFSESRLLFAGGRDLPNGFWASKIAAFYNFDAGTGLDNEGIWYSAFSELGVVEIRHLIKSRFLHVLTDRQELWCPIDPSKTITPATFGLKSSTNYGVRSMRPVVMEDAVLICQREGTAIRELMYQYFQNNVTADPITHRSAHLFRDRTPIDMGVLSQAPQASGRPEQYGFVVMSDGSLNVYHAIRAEKMAGWVPWTTNGSFTSIAVAISDVFVSVLRQGSYFLELFDWTATLDCSATGTSAATLNWTGVAWLAGQTVACVGGANDTYCGTAVVDGGGNLTLDASNVPPTRLTVGLEYSPIPTLELLPPDGALQSGPINVVMRRISRLIVAVDTSLSLALSGGATLLTRQVIDAVESAPAGVTGAYSFFLIGYSRRPTAMLTSPIPLPLTVLGFECTVGVG